MDTQEMLKQVAQDEQAVILERFTSADAWDLGCLMVQLARDQGHALTISIDVNGQKLFYYAFDGTHLNNESAVARKIRVSHTFRCCSMQVFCELQASGGTIADRGRDPNDYLAVGGAVPIRLKNCGMIGTVCVSGMAPADDHRFVIDAMKAYLAQQGGIKGDQ